jgi:hypothetical protein
VGIIGATETKRTDLTAHIIDMKSASKSGVVSTTAESQGFYGVVVILPIVVPAMTESTACKRLGSEIVMSISSGAEDKSVIEGQ